MAGPIGGSAGIASRFVHGGRGRLLITLAIGAFAIRAVPVLAGGGLQGLHGYDDGVYFGGATALVHGALPYRDFLLLHPPGMVLGLSPFAMLGNLTGDPAAFAVARVAIMVLGAVNAVLVALVAGRYNRLAGLTAGALYAVWSTASNVERTTDLHGPQNTFVLLGLLALARSGRIGPRRAALSGVFIGLAISVQLWQAASFVVILWWVLVHGRGDGWHRLRPAAAYITGAAIACGLVCIPFFVAAPEPMVRYLIVDQIGRPNVGVDIIDRLRVLEGFAQLAQMPPVLRQFVPDPIVLGAACAALAIVVVTAWVCPWTRLWAVLALVQTAVVLATPSFFNDYPSFAAPAATLVFGTAVAVSLGRLTRRRASPRHGHAVIGLLLAPLAAISLFRLEGERLPLAELESDISRARCVSADSPALLVLTSAMRRNLDARCLLVLDPTGVSYDTDRSLPHPRSPGNWRLHAPGYQAAMVAWYTSGDVAMFVRPRSDGLTRGSQDAIARRLPVEVRRGIVVVRFAAR